MGRIGLSKEEELVVMECNEYSPNDDFDPETSISSFSVLSGLHAYPRTFMGSLLSE